MSHSLNASATPTAELNKAFSELSSCWQRGQGFLDVSFGGGHASAGSMIAETSALRQAIEHFKNIWASLFTEVFAENGLSTSVLITEFDALERFRSDNSIFPDAAGDFIVHDVFFDNDSLLATHINVPDDNGVKVAYKVDALYTLTNLQRLSLLHRKVSDPASVAEISSLKHLELCTSEVNSLSVLAKLNLKELHWQQAPPSGNIEPLKQEVFDFSVFSRFKNLEGLKIDLCGRYQINEQVCERRYFLFSDFSALTNVPSLKRLAIDYGIIKVEVEKALPSLEGLSLTKCEADDLSFLEKMQSLLSLTIQESSISEKLDKLPPQLKEISLLSSKVVDLKATLIALLQLSELKSVMLWGVNDGKFSLEEHDLIRQLNEKTGNKVCL